MIRRHLELGPIINRITIATNGDRHPKEAILESTEYPGVAVRVGCHRRFTSCEFRQGGRVCWEPIRVFDPNGNITVYNRRTVFCRGSEEGRVLTDEFLNQEAEIH